MKGYFYVYCSNDPINLYDPFGNLSLIPLLIGFWVPSLIGMIVGGVSYVLSEQISYSFTKEFSWSDAQFVGNLLGGAIGGGLSI